MELSEPKLSSNDEGSHELLATIEILDLTLTLLLGSSVDHLVKFVDELWNQLVSDYQWVGIS